MKIKVWKSLTFAVGLVLFIAAFVGILVAGSILNPPPYRVAIVIQDVAPYTVLTRDMLAIDEQTMNTKVASRLVHEQEVDLYIGGLVVEAIHAGEPLRRNAVVAAGNPAAVHRLSLALTDPNLVAVVVPVDAKNIPPNVTAGDYVNVTMGIAGSVGQLTSWDLSPPAPLPGEEGAGDVGEEPPLATVPPALTPVSTSTVPVVRTPAPAPESPPAVGGNGVVYPSEDGEELDVQPPLTKIILPQVIILNVAREQVPNPNYGMGMGEGSEMQPAYLEGDIEAITLLVPRAAEELLYFAVDNGTIHVSIVPHTAVEEGAAPSTGILWTDIVSFIEREREAALGVITPTVEAEVTEEPAIGTKTPEDDVPTSTPAPEADAEGTPESEEEAPAATTAPGPGSAIGMTGEIMTYLLPMCIGGGIVVIIGTIAVMILRRRKKGS